MSELLKVNVNDHTEKKNGLTYLSWAWAWAEVLKVDPSARFEVRTFREDKQPVCWIGDSAMVCVEVVVKGISRECWLPVMDNRNKAIKNPDAFAINTAIMRCMTKAVSLHGLGLYIYAGEDLPEGEPEPQKPASPIPATFRSSPTMGEMESLSADEQTYIRDLAAEVVAMLPTDPRATVERIEAESLDDTQKMALWSILDSKTRAAIKKAQATMKETATA